MTTLAEFALQMRQQQARPCQCPLDPTPEFLSFQQVEAFGERIQGKAFGHEEPHHPEDLSKTGGFVGEMGAGGDARETPPRQRELLDGDGMLPITRQAHSTTIATERAKRGMDRRANQDEPCRMLVTG